MTNNDKSIKLFELLIVQIIAKMTNAQEYYYLMIYRVLLVTQQIHRLVACYLTPVQKRSGGSG